jgi:hypothetical protein
VIALVLLLTALGCITMGLRGHQVPLPGPVAVQDTPPAADGVAAGGVGAASSGVSSPVVGVGGTPQLASPRQPDLLPAPSPARSSADLGVPGPAQSGSPGGTARTSVGVDPVAPRPAPVAPRPAPPVALRIPAIGVDVSLSTLGLNADHTVEVPTDFQQAGWFGLGPSPGQTGSAVILGHVDSYTGPAVFFQIRTLRAGDQVNVSLADGAIAHFQVTAVAMYAKDQFPAQQVYAPHGGSALQLVTCGGTFDTHTRSYLSNIVAYTTLIVTTPATGQ